MWANNLHLILDVSIIQLMNKSLLCSSIEKEDLDDIEQVVVVRGLCKAIRYVISLFILGQKVRETQKIIEYGSIIHHFGMTQQANVNLNSKVLTIGISQ